MGNLSMFLRHLTNGISLGSLYALIAIGYTMVYGILRLINFAHGDIFMLGVYLTYFGILYTSIPWWLVFVIAPPSRALSAFSWRKCATSPCGFAQDHDLDFRNWSLLSFTKSGDSSIRGRPRAFPVPRVLNHVVKVRESPSM